MDADRRKRFAKGGNIRNEYRTQEQFESIADNVHNGQWAAAAEECVEYGFFAKDLLSYNEELELIDMEDLVYLAEAAQKKR